MNCQYCQKLLEMQMGEHFPTTPIHTRSWIGECKECHVIYHSRKEQTVGGLLHPPHCIIWEDIFLEDKKYRIRIYPKHTLFEVTYVVPEFQGTVFETVHLFRFIPDWTPQNVKEKLMAYLPFL